MTVVTHVAGTVGYRAVLAQQLDVSGITFVDCELRRAIDRRQQSKLALTGAK